MVVQRSQMDPKEYLPFLNELNAMEDVHLRRFSIDSSLKRHDAAVVHLCRCRPVRTAEIVAFMKLHKSYAPVVDHFCSDGNAIFFSFVIECQQVKESLLLANMKCIFLLITDGKTKHSTGIAQY